MVLVVEVKIRTNASEELIEVMEWIKISSVIGVMIWIVSDVYRHWWN